MEIDGASPELFFCAVGGVDIDFPARAGFVTTGGALLQMVRRDFGARQALALQAEVTCGLLPNGDRSDNPVLHVVAVSGLTTGGAASSDAPPPGGPRGNEKMAKAWLPPQSAL